MTCTSLDAERVGILTAIKSSLDNVAGQLGTDGRQGAIASDTLQVTWIGGAGTAVAGAVGAILGVTKGHNDTVNVAGLAFGAVALVAVALIVISDHRTRASAYATLDTTLPALMTAAAAFVPPNSAPAGDGVGSTRPGALPPGSQLQIQLVKPGEPPSDLFTVRVRVVPGSP